MIPVTVIAIDSFIQTNENMIPVTVNSIESKDPLALINVRQQEV